MQCFETTQDYVYSCSAYKGIIIYVCIKYKYATSRNDQAL